MERFNLSTTQSVQRVHSYIQEFHVILVVLLLLSMIFWLLTVKNSIYLHALTLMPSAHSEIEMCSFGFCLYVIFHFSMSFLLFIFVLYDILGAAL